ncbi:MAG: hypothetical protein LBV12_11495 [Puniceicoccales bacterium]|jgi:hypothetical protein|nr:hypothetical protein [Puniceicoccales bacterium]
MSTRSKVNVLSPGFGHTDTMLIDNDFYPVVYIPGYGVNADMMEYQYMRGSELQEYKRLNAKLVVMKL